MDGFCGSARGESGLHVRHLSCGVRGLDGRDKAKAFPREGANAGLLLASVADGLAHGIDPAGQRRFGDNAAAPDRGNQIIFADDAITIFDEIDQKIENLRLESDRNVARAQLPALAIQHIIIE